MKVEPLQGSLSTQIRPPCISTNFFVIERPRPEPPYSDAIVASVCLNSVKRLANLVCWNADAGVRDLIGGAIRPCARLRPRSFRLW
jgi:hypothetical protein